VPKTPPARPDTQQPATLPWTVATNRDRGVVLHGLASRVRIIVKSELNSSSQAQLSWSCQRVIVRHGWWSRSGDSAQTFSSPPCSFGARLSCSSKTISHRGGDISVAVTTLPQHSSRALDVGGWIPRRHDLCTNEFAGTLGHAATLSSGPAV
jgi:hypothetical protein